MKIVCVVISYGEGYGDACVSMERGMGTLASPWRGVWVSLLWRVPTNLLKEFSFES